MNKYNPTINSLKAKYAKASDWKEFNEEHPKPLSKAKLRRLRIKEARKSSQA